MSKTQRSNRKTNRYVFKELKKVEEQCSEMADVLNTIDTVNYKPKSQQFTVTTN